MKYRLTDENTAAEDLLPPKQPDGSGIGVNYIDAYIKPFNVKVDDGPAVKCKRKGLKILFQIGDAKGEAVMNRLQDGPDPRDILRVALGASAAAAGMRFLIDEGGVFLEALEEGA